MQLPAVVADFCHELADDLAIALGDDLVGVYVHGSAVLGGFVAKRSDIDLLVVVAGRLPAGKKEAAAAVLRRAHDGCPGVGIECSVVTRRTAGSGGVDCAYELHVSTHPDDEAAIHGGAHDPDLVLHFAVCRQAAANVKGPAAASMFAGVPQERLRNQICDELRWCLDNGTAQYAVLNACRALRYDETGGLVSKVEGGRWAIDRGLDRTVISQALETQQGTRTSFPRSPRVAALVRTILQRMETG